MAWRRDDNGGGGGFRGAQIFNSGECFFMSGECLFNSVECLFNSVDNLAISLLVVTSSRCHHAVICRHSGCYRDSDDKHGTDFSLADFSSEDHQFEPAHLSSFINKTRQTWNSKIQNYPKFFCKCKKSAAKCLSLQRE